MFRSLLAILYVLIYLIVSLPFLGIEYLVAKRHPEKADQTQLHAVQWGLRCVTKIAGTRVEVVGLEKVPDDRALLFVANHQSIFDVVIAYSLMKRQTGFVSKDSIGKIPVLNIYMKRLHCLFLDRNNIRSGMKMIIKAIAQTKDGISTFIFPEGTRNKTNDELNLAEFHDGSFKVAERSGCPVVPVAIHNTVNIFEKHLPFLKKTDVVIEFGESVQMSDVPEEFSRYPGKYFRGLIIDMLKKYQDTDAG